MTSAPVDLGAFRTGAVIPKTGLSGDAVGIAPDASHLAGGGYHVGCEDIQRIGRWNTDYSTRQARDRLDGTNDASAMDIGDNWPRGGRAGWLRFNNLLVARLRASDPELAALRAVNFSPDGTARKRYDSLHPGDGVIDSTDTVYMHTHLEWWRDTKSTAARARSLARIGQIIDAAITNTQLGGDDMATVDDVYLLLQRALNGFGDSGNPVSRNLVAAWVGQLQQDGRSANAKLDALTASVAADAARDQAMLTAIQKLAVGSGADPQPILDAIAAVRVDTHAAVVQLQQQLADAHAELAAVRVAAEANLSPAERAAIEASPGA